MTTALRFARVTSPSVILLAVAALAWVMTALGVGDTEAMPGTMGLGPGAFVGMWALMMAAMMLPAAAPLGAAYARSLGLLGLAGFAGGYLLVWAASGVPAFALAALADAAVGGHSAATAVAVVVFAACGLYQLSPLKRHCLAHCRAPLSLLLRYASYRGPLRHARAGTHHGATCLGCCWALSGLLVAVGAMNVPAMVAIAAVIAIERSWSGGEALARTVGAAALVLAVAVVWAPGLAPGVLGAPAGAMSHGMHMAVPR